MKHTYKTIFSFLLLFTFLTTNGQNNTVRINKVKSFGILTSFAFVNEALPEGGNYSPTIIQGNFRFPLLNTDSRHQLTLLLQPQYNPVKSIENQTHETLFEAGVNVGLAYEYLVSDNVGIAYLGLGAGPHYINVETGLQADGFIFSDNFYAGFHQFVGNRSWFLTYEIRFRHISNAGLQTPNGGIDNFFAGFGVSYFLF